MEVSEFGFIYRVLSCESAKCRWISPGNPTDKAIASSSSKGNLFVRTQFGGVPSAIEEVVQHGSVAYLV